MAAAIGRRGLLREARRLSEAAAAPDSSCRVAKKSIRPEPHEVRWQFPAADQVGSVPIFDVLGGSYSLIATVNYTPQTVFVKALPTHKEYEGKEWMKWA